LALTDFDGRCLICGMPNDDVKTVFQHLKDFHPVLDSIIEQVKPKSPAASDEQIKSWTGYSPEDYISRAIERLSPEQVAEQAYETQQQAEAAKLREQDPDMGLFLEEFQKIRAKLDDIIRWTAPRA
jgi:hypothetical protein